MHNTKLIFGAILIGCTLLIGCSNTTKINQISSDIKKLNIKTKRISNKINKLHSDIETIKHSAARANQRLDNLTNSYHK